jgi:hypothetical protein
MAFYQVTDKRTGEIKTLEAAESDKHGLATVIEQSGLGRVDVRDWRGRTKNILDKRQLIVAIAEANSLVLDAKLGWALEFVEPSAIPDEAQQFKFNGKMVYYLIRSRDKDTDGVIYPYKRPEIITVTPQKMWRATKIRDKIIALFRPKNTPLEKLLIGMLVGIALGEIFILYLFVQG